MVCLLIWGFYFFQQDLSFLPVAPFFFRHHKCAKDAAFSSVSHLIPGIMPPQDCHPRSCALLNPFLSIPQSPELEPTVSQTPSELIHVLFLRVTLPELCLECVQYDGKTYLYKGKKITLTVNGKTYSAKTDSKGVAKFNVKLTKKGKYSAKVKFGGDSTYKSSNKSIKVTIK